VSSSGYPIDTAGMYAPTSAMFFLRNSNTAGDADIVYLVMRLYWPKTQAPSILPQGEGTWNPPRSCR
jgi:hypothetical protein